MYNPIDRGRAPEGREAVGRNSRLAASALKQLRKPGSRREKLGWAQSGGRSTERESNLRRGNSEVLPNEPQFGETEAGRCVEERARVDLSSWSSAIDWSAWALAETKEIPICPVNARVHKAQNNGPPKPPMKVQWRIRGCQRTLHCGTPKPVWRLGQMGGTLS